MQDHSETSRSSPGVPEPEIPDRDFLGRFRPLDENGKGITNYKIKELSNSQKHFILPGASKTLITIKDLFELNKMITADYSKDHFDLLKKQIKHKVEHGRFINKKKFYIMKRICKSISKYPSLKKKDIVNFQSWKLTISVYKKKVIINNKNQKTIQALCLEGGPIKGKLQQYGQ
jgi:hypothetical protein